MDPNRCIEQIKLAVTSAPHPGPPNPDVFQPTAVMALFMMKEQTELLFIQKADREGYPWRNQMAFPGGHVEKNDSSTRATALREMEEELCIRPENVDVIGSIGHFQTINNKDIQAFAGIWNQTDEIRFDTEEISRVFHIPFSLLMKIHMESGYHNTPGDIMTLTYPYRDVTIWGVTAKILHHLLEIVQIR